MNYKNVIGLMEIGGLTLDEAKKLDSEGMISNSLEFDHWCELHSMGGDDIPCITESVEWEADSIFAEIPVDDY